MKKLEKLTLKELEKEFSPISKYEQAGYVGGEMGCTVVIEAIRYGFGQNTTVSSFTASAFNDNGEITSTMTGYFLEPAYDGGSNGSDRAIPYGTYNVEPTTYKNVPGYYEVVNVPNRSRIIIHEGNTGAQTSGCFLPGTSVGGSGGRGDYYVDYSVPKLTELTNFLDTYGADGITLRIGIIINNE